MKVKPTGFDDYRWDGEAQTEIAGWRATKILPRKPPPPPQDQTLIALN